MSVDDWGQSPAQQQGEWGTPPPGATQAQQQPPAGIPTPEAPSLDEALGVGGVPSFSFDGPIGTTADGLIVDIPKGRQKTDFDSKLPVYWEQNKLTTNARAADGTPNTPAWTYPIHIQTNLRDPQIPDDDGVRAIFFEYKKLEALKAAKKAANADKVEAGGRLLVRYMSGGPKDKNPNATRNKVYTVKYFPPGSPEAQQLANAPRPATPPPAPQPAQPDSWGAHQYATEERPF